MTTSTKKAPTRAKAKRSLGFFPTPYPGLRFLGVVRVRDAGKESYYSLFETPGSNAGSSRSFVVAKIDDAREVYFTLVRPADGKGSCNCRHGERRAKDASLKPCRHVAAVAKLIETKKV